MDILAIFIVTLVVAVLIGLNALYVAGEFAAVSARRPRLAQMAEGGSRMAKVVLGIVKDPHRLDNYIAASQVGITLSSIGLGIYGQQAIAPRLAPWLSGLAGEAAAAGISATLVLIILTTLQVIFGELMPKTVAIQHPERVALLTALPMRWSAEIILKPLIVLLNGSGRLILKLLRVPAGGKHAHIHSPEEIVILLSESHRSGLLDANERSMLRSVFRVSKTRAQEIVVPRKRIVAAEADQPLREILEKAALSAYSRLPIFEGTIDHITGYVHLLDVYKLYRRDPHASIRTVLRPVPFVPESVPVTQVWAEMNQADAYMAIVFDEYGGTTGLITRKDVIEELFGELPGEFDRKPELVRHLSDGRMVVRGNMSISALNEMLESDLPNKDVVTVAGLLQSALGRMPQTGDRVEVQDIQFEVEAAAGNTVTAVCVITPEDQPPDRSEPGSDPGEEAEA